MLSRAYITVEYASAPESPTVPNSRSSRSLYDDSDSQWTDHVNDPLEILGGHAAKNQNSVRFVLVIKKGKSFFNLKQQQHPPKKKKKKKKRQWAQSLHASSTLELVSE